MQCRLYEHKWRDVHHPYCVWCWILQHIRGAVHRLRNRLLLRSSPSRELYTGACICPLLSTYSRFLSLLADLCCPLLLISNFPPRFYPLFPRFYLLPTLFCSILPNLRAFCPLLPTFYDFFSLYPLFPSAFCSIPPMSAGFVLHSTHFCALFCSFLVRLLITFADISVFAAHFYAPTAHISPAIYYLLTSTHFSPASASSLSDFCSILRFLLHSTHVCALFSRFRRSIRFRSTSILFADICLLAAHFYAAMPTFPAIYYFYPLLPTISPLCLLLRFLLKSTHFCVLSARFKFVFYSLSADITRLTAHFYVPTARFLPVCNSTSTHFIPISPRFCLLPIRLLLNSTHVCALSARFRRFIRFNSTSIHFLPV
jgi:hypothetical protein